MSTAEPTTTSYAILGLLSLRPWTTYELALQMDRALGLFWPRTRSKLYEEPKKLVALGLAKATRETVGKRARTVYSITAKGRRALAAWVPTPADGPQIEFETLVKIFFAEQGSRRDLLNHLDEVRAWANRLSRDAAGIPQSYLRGEGAFPQRLPWLILCGKFIDDFIEMVDGWAEWAGEVVDQWPDDLDDAEADVAVLREMAAHTDERSARAATTELTGPGC